LDPKFGIKVQDVDADQAFPSSEKFSGTGSSFAQQLPRRVTFTSRMKHDLEALFQKTRDASPPKCRVRSLRVVRATYGFGDASGDGFGAAILLPDGKIFYQHGVWNWLISNEPSSNYRELRNLVESLEKAAEAGRVADKYRSVVVYRQHHRRSRLLPRFLQVKARFGVEAPAFGHEARHHHPGYSCVWKKNDSGRLGQNKPCVQYDTVRPSAISYQWRALLDGQTALVMMQGTTKLITSTYPTNGEWFERFMLGYHKRVGDVSRPDLAISIEVMVALMVRFERLWILADGDGPSQEKALFPALFAISTYTGGLRGEDTPLMDLHATGKHSQEGINHPTHPHVVMALRGRFKNEVGELEHLKPLAVETKSGLKVGVWFKRMLLWYEARGVTRGPVFWDSRGNRPRAGRYELAILTELEWSQKLIDGLISPNVRV
jgi:hypothetical protein